MPVVRDRHGPTGESLRFENRQCLPKQKEAAFAWGLQGVLVSEARLPLTQK